MPAGKPTPVGAAGTSKAFAAEFLSAPLVVGSPFPSSRSMVRALLHDLPWDRIESFVEFGPGTGAFTRYALKRMRADAKLLTIDAERGFVDYLRRSIRDPRLVAVTGSAVDVSAIAQGHGIDRIDCVLSGLPFSAIEEPDRRAIVERAATMMNASGLFLAYQVRRAIEPPLRDAFERVESRYHWLNLPPCHLYRASMPRMATRPLPGK